MIYVAREFIPWLLRVALRVRQLTPFGFASCSTWGDPKTALDSPLALLGETPRPQWLLYLGRPQDRTDSPLHKELVLQEAEPLDSGSQALPGNQETYQLSIINYQLSIITYHLSLFTFHFSLFPPATTPAKPPQSKDFLPSSSHSPIVDAGLSSFVNVSSRLYPLYF